MLHAHGRLPDSLTRLPLSARHVLGLQGRCAHCPIRGAQSMSSTSDHKAEHDLDAESVESSSAFFRDHYTLVLKGGGIRGLAFAGALFELERFYSFNRFVGTSAGAITALFLAAECNADQLKEILMRQDFRRLLDGRGPALLRIWRYGHVHSGDRFTQWISEELAHILNEPISKKITLESLSQKTGKHLTIIVAQPDAAIVRFSSDGQERHTPAAVCARFSMSIPFFFRAHEHHGSSCYDGGLVANYPLLDALGSGDPDKTLGICLDEPKPHFLSRKVRGFRQTLVDVIEILLKKDEQSIVDANRVRTVSITTKPVTTLSFQLTKTEKEYLHLRGRQGAISFLIERLRELEHESKDTERAPAQTSIDALVQRAADVARGIAELQPAVEKLANRRARISKLLTRLQVFTILLFVLSIGYAANSLVVRLGSDRAERIAEAEWVTTIGLADFFESDAGAAELSDLKAKVLDSYSNDVDRSMYLQFPEIGTRFIYLKKDDSERVVVKLQYIVGASATRQAELYSFAKATGGDAKNMLFTENGGSALPAEVDHVLKRASVEAASDNTVRALNVGIYRQSLNDETAYLKAGDHWIVDAKKWARDSATVLVSLVTPNENASLGNVRFWEVGLAVEDGIEVFYRKREEHRYGGWNSKLVRQSSDMFDEWIEMLDKFIVSKRSSEQARVLRDLLDISGKETLVECLSSNALRSHFRVVSFHARNFKAPAVLTFQWSGADGSELGVGQLGDQHPPGTENKFLPP